MTQPSPKVKLYVPVRCNFWRRSKHPTLTYLTPCLLVLFFSVLSSLHLHLHHPEIDITSFLIHVSPSLTADPLKFRKQIMLVALVVTPTSPQATGFPGLLQNKDGGRVRVRARAVPLERATQCPGLPKTEESPDTKHFPFENWDAGRQTWMVGHRTSWESSPQWPSPWKGKYKGTIPWPWWGAPPPGWAAFSSLVKCQEPRCLLSSAPKQGLELSERWINCWMKEHIEGAKGPCLAEHPYPRRALSCSHNPTHMALHPTPSYPCPPNVVHQAPACFCTTIYIHLNYFNKSNTFFFFKERDR